MSNLQHTIRFTDITYAKFWYVNQYGDTRKTKPDMPTYHGTPVHDNELSFLHGEGPKERLVDHIIRKKCIDVWTARCKYQLRNSHSFLYTGEEAIKKWKQYNAHIYNNK